MTGHFPITVPPQKWMPFIGWRTEARSSVVCEIDLNLQRAPGEICIHILIFELPRRTPPRLRHTSLNACSMWAPKVCCRHSSHSLRYYCLIGSSLFCRHQRNHTLLPRTLGRSRKFLLEFLIRITLTPLSSVAQVSTSPKGRESKPETTFFLAKISRSPSLF